MTALTGLSTLSALTAQSGAVSIDALRLLPALAPALGALLVLLVDALAPRRTLPHLVVGALALLMGAAGAMPGALSPAREPVLTLCLPGGPDGACLWSAGPLDSTLQIGLLAASLAALLLLSDQWRGLPGDRAVDVALILASAAGGAAVVAARELGTWLVALELATLPVIALVVLRGTRRAAHGGLTLMMTSLLSFAVLVVGTGLWVMATGDASLSGTAIRTAWAEPDQRAVLVLAILTLFVGLGFKLSLVPFHAWTPPTFVSGPLPISALLATASKLAAVGALLALIAPFAGLADPHPHALAFVVGALAIGSMLVGTVVAFRATDLVRLLAWSTIAQAGWVMLPLAAGIGARPRGIPRAGAVPPPCWWAADPCVAHPRRTAAGDPGPGRQGGGHSSLAGGRAVATRGAGRDRGRARHRGVCPLDCGAAGRTGAPNDRGIREQRRHGGGGAGGARGAGGAVPRHGAARGRQRRASGALRSAVIGLLSRTGERPCPVPTLEETCTVITTASRPPASSG